MPEIHQKIVSAQENLSRKVVQDVGIYEIVGGLKIKRGRTIIIIRDNGNIDINTGAQTNSSTDEKITINGGTIDITDGDVNIISGDVNITGGDVSIGATDLQSVCVEGDETESAVGHTHILKSTRGNKLKIGV